jgi:aminopeptidase
VFPDDPEEIAVAELWHGIFAASRIDTTDPVADWQAHNRDLKARSDHLNGKSYAALHFRGPGTDLVVGLADDHVWRAAPFARTSSATPTHPPRRSSRRRTRTGRGRVTSLSPLSYQAR